MAKTREYMDYLDDAIGIAPANSQEEYQASEVISQLMKEHGIDARVEEFDSHGSGAFVRDVLCVVLFVVSLVAGLVPGVPHVVLLVVTLAIAGLLTFAHFVRDVFDGLGPGRQSQNVVGVHRAQSENVVRGSRPIVVVAHYDTPRESVFRRVGLVRYQPILTKVGAFCPAVVAVAALLQVMMFLPDVVRIFAWVVGLIAALPTLALAVMTIVSRFGECTLGSNDNKSSVAAMLAVLDKVSPAEDRASSEAEERPVWRKPRKSEQPSEPVVRQVEVVEPVKGVRHGADVLRSLGILPPTCEITYEEPRVTIVEERLDAEFESTDADEEQWEPVDGESFDDVDGDEVDEYDELDAEEFDEDEELGEGEYDEDEGYDDEFEEDLEDEPASPRRFRLGFINLPQVDGEDEAEEFDDEESVDEDDYDYDDEYEEGFEDEGYVEEGDAYEDDDLEDDAYDEQDDEYEAQDYEEDEYDFDQELPDDEEEEEDAPIGSSIGAWFQEKIGAIRGKFGSKESNEGDGWIDDEDLEDEESYEDDGYDDEAYEDEEYGAEWESDSSDEDAYADEDEQTVDDEDYDFEEYGEDLDAAYDDVDADAAYGDEDEGYAEDTAEEYEYDDEYAGFDAADYDDDPDALADLAFDAEQEQDYASDFEYDEGESDDPDEAYGAEPYDVDYEQEDEEPQQEERSRGFRGIRNLLRFGRGKDEVADGDLESADAYALEDEPLEEDAYPYESYEEADESYVDDVDVEYADDGYGEYADGVAYDEAGSTDDYGYASAGYEEDPDVEDDSYDYDEPNEAEAYEPQWENEDSYDYERGYDEYDAQDVGVADELEEYAEERGDAAKNNASIVQKFLGIFRGGSRGGTRNADAYEYDEYDEGDEYYLEDDVDEYASDELIEDDGYEEDEQPSPYEESADQEYDGTYYAEQDGAYYEDTYYEDAYYDENTAESAHDVYVEDIEQTDPESLHLDRDEDDDIVARDDSGLSMISDSYDLYDGDVQRESRRARPAAVDDPMWGTSTYTPTRPSMNIARRAALFDLPDPSGAEVDPLDDDFEYEDNIPATRYEEERASGRGGFWNDADAARASEWKGGATKRDDLRDDEYTGEDEELRDAMLDLGDEFLQQHDVWFVATGASSEGNAGIKAFLDAHRRDIRGAYLVNLECVGSGELAVYTREGLASRRRSDRRLVRMICDIARDLHIGMGTATCDWMETDAAAANRARIRSATIVGLDEDGMPALANSVDDVPENVSPDQVDDVVRIVTEVIRRA